MSVLFTAAAGVVHAMQSERTKFRSRSDESDEMASEERQAVSLDFESTSCIYESITICDRKKILSRLDPFLFKTSRYKRRE